MPIIGQISVGDGATFTPAVDSDGVISWTNNKNLTNPASVDIPQAVVDRYQLAPTSNPTFTGTVTAEDITASGTITGDLTGTASGNLPLSGGTMTGGIGFNTASPSIMGNVTTGRIGILAGSNIFDGSTLQLFGRNDSSYAGRFYLRASTKSSADSSGAEKSLVGGADGTLTWGGNDITPQTENIVNADSVSAPNNTGVNVLSFTVGKGTWYVHYSVDFPANANGYRSAFISTNGTTGASYNRLSWVRYGSAGNSASTHVGGSCIVRFSASTTVYLFAQQNSGSTLTISGGVSCFRLSSIV